MTLAQREQDLHKNFPDYVLSNEVTLSAALLNELRHVAIGAVFHYYVQLARFLIDNFFVILNDVGVP